MREVYKMAKKYYGIAGENGYGVFNDYDKVLEIRGSIRKYKIKGFNWWKEAKLYATNEFHSLQDGVNKVPLIAEIKRTNYFYRKRNFRKTHKESMI